MTPPTVQVKTTEQLQARRAELLGSVHLSEDQLRQRADDYSLSPELVAVLDEIKDIDYLLDA